MDDKLALNGAFDRRGSAIWLDDQEEAARCGVADPAALRAGHELAARGVGEDFDHGWLPGCTQGARRRLLCPVTPCA